MDVPLLLLFAASCIYSPFRAIAFLFLMVLLDPYGRNWTRETRPINSANPAISEIINKNPNEAKSAVIEAFLCGRCLGHCAAGDARFNRQRLSNRMPIDAHSEV